MKVSIVQSALIWEDKAKNRQNFAQKLLPLRGATDLVVLPEMFTTGFSMRPELLAEKMDGPTVHWMRQQSELLQCAVTGSFICEENGQYHNRLLWVLPDGTCHAYDKRHLFTLAGEHEHYTPGNSKLIVEYMGWKICPLICYDLRFPVWGRNVEGYDLLIYVANWPSRRSLHWKTLLQARAIENQSYTIGVNVVGKDGNDLEYTGDSAILDCLGQHICQISGQEGVFTAELNSEYQQKIRQQLTFLSDRDNFEINK